MLGGAPAGVNDWTGGSLGNYLTALGVADALARQYHNPREQPLVQDLSQSVWASESPEQYEAAGFIHGPGNTVDVVVVLASALSWNGTFAPAIQSP
jgi:hypothetical protein